MRYDSFGTLPLQVGTDLIRMRHKCPSATGQRLINDMTWHIDNIEELQLFALSDLKGNFG